MGGFQPHSQMITEHLFPTDIMHVYVKHIPHHPASLLIASVSTLDVGGSCRRSPHTQPRHLDTLCRSTASPPVQPAPAAAAALPLQLLPPTSLSTGSAGTSSSLSAASPTAPSQTTRSTCCPPSTRSVVKGLPRGMPASGSHPGRCSTRSLCWRGWSSCSTCASRSAQGEQTCP